MWRDCGSLRSSQLPSKSQKRLSTMLTNNHPKLIDFANIGLAPKHVKYLGHFLNLASLLVILSFGLVGLLFSVSGAWLLCKYNKRHWGWCFSGLIPVVGPWIVLDEFSPSNKGSNGSQPKVSGAMIVITFSTLYLLLLSSNIIEYFNSITVPVESWHPSYSVSILHSTVTMFFGAGIAVFCIPIVVYIHTRRLFETRNPTFLSKSFFAAESILAALFVTGIILSNSVSDRIEQLYDKRIERVFSQLSIGMDASQVKKIVEKANLTLKGRSSSSRGLFSLNEQKSKGAYQVYHRTQILTAYHDSTYYLELIFSRAGTLQQAQYYVAVFADGSYDCTVFLEIPNGGQTFPYDVSADGCMELMDSRNKG